MAKRTVVELHDDLDGGPATATVSFGLDGIQYEIDLSSANASQLRKVLEPYAEVARRLSPTGRPYRTTVLDADPRAIRAWAHKNGLECPANGRIPAAVREAWRRAHPSDA
ncbi:MAG: Lsr2 family protein [Mycobacteriales bacterium]|jgi:hypothetical protein